MTAEGRIHPPGPKRAVPCQNGERGRSDHITKVCKTSQENHYGGFVMEFKKIIMEDL